MMKFLTNLLFVISLTMFTCMCLAGTARVVQWAFVAVNTSPFVVMAITLATGVYICVYLAAMGSKSNKKKKSDAQAAKELVAAIKKMQVEHPELFKK